MRMEEEKTINTILQINPENIENIIGNLDENPDKNTIETLEISVTNQKFNGAINIFDFPKLKTLKFIIKDLGFYNNDLHTEEEKDNLGLLFVNENTKENARYGLVNQQDNDINILISMKNTVDDEVENDMKIILLKDILNSIENMLEYQEENNLIIINGVNLSIDHFKEDKDSPDISVNKKKFALKSLKTQISEYLNERKMQEISDAANKKSKIIEPDLNKEIKTLIYNIDQEVLKNKNILNTFHTIKNTLEDPRITKSQNDLKEILGNLQEIWNEINPGSQLPKNLFNTEEISEYDAKGKLDHLKRWINENKNNDSFEVASEIYKAQFESYNNNKTIESMKEINASLDLCFDQIIGLKYTNKENTSLKDLEVVRLPFDIVPTNLKNMKDKKCAYLNQLRNVIIMYITDPDIVNLIKMYNEHIEIYNNAKTTDEYNDSYYEIENILKKYELQHDKLIEIGYKYTDGYFLDSETIKSLPFDEAFKKLALEKQKKNQQLYKLINPLIKSNNKDIHLRIISLPNIVVDALINIIEISKKNKIQCSDFINDIFSSNKIDLNMFNRTDINKFSQAIIEFGNSIINKDKSLDIKTLNDLNMHIVNIMNTKKEHYVIQFLKKYSLESFLAFILLVLLIILIVQRIRSKKKPTKK